MKNVNNITKEKPIRILSSAEAFGYGPCSKLVCIVTKIKSTYNTYVHFIGDAAALDFAQQNSGLFNNIQEYDGTYPNPDNYDLVISVMNPYLAIWGWFNRKKVVYVDSLYWFWKFEDERFKQVESIIEELTNAESIDDMWAITKDISGHHLHYVAHRLATMSCSQYFNDDLQKNKGKFRKTLKNVIDVNPIIDLSHKKEGPKDTVLICLGGLLSPLNQKKEALAYVNLILKIAGPFISEASKKYKVILTTNPEITKLIKDPQQNLTITSLSHKETLQAINRSVVVLTPAGITTMYECLFYERPFFVLPELHDGHYPNYLRLIKSDKSKLTKLSSVVKNALISTRTVEKFERNPDNEIKRIQSIIKKLNISNTPLLRELQNSVTGLLKYLDPNMADKMASDQHSLIMGAKHKKNDDILDIVIKTIQENKPPVIKRKSVVGIISSAVEIMKDKTKKDMTSLGQNLGKLNVNIATGASIGMTEIIASGAKTLGSRLIGFSPASNALIHSRVADNATIDQFDSIHFDGKGFTARSLDFINSVDVILMISGRMGTLSEFTIAFEEGVPIFVLKGYGGVSDKIDKIMSYANKIGLTLPIICENTDELIKQLSDSLSSKYYN